MLEARVEPLANMIQTQVASQAEVTEQLVQASDSIAHVPPSSEPLTLATVLEDSSMNRSQRFSQQRTARAKSANDCDVHGTGAGEAVDAYGGIDEVERCATCWEVFHSYVFGMKRRC